LSSIPSARPPSVRGSCGTSSGRADEAMLLIPAIDLHAGRCVRLYQGDFGAEVRYPADPRELLARYRELGARWLHVVDLDGARDWTADADICLWDAVERYASTGLRHVLCTDIARDGTFLGPNFELYRAARKRFPHLLWQASGGVSSAADLADLERTGVTAAVCGKALLEERIKSEELRPFWPDASSPAST